MISSCSPSTVQRCSFVPGINLGSCLRRGRLSVSEHSVDLQSSSGDSTARIWKISGDLKEKKLSSVVLDHGTKLPRGVTSLDWGVRQPSLKTLNAIRPMINSLPELTMEA